MTFAGIRWFKIIAFILLLNATSSRANPAVLARAEALVKLYGAGAGRIETYGTGLAVSPDGHVLTTLTSLLSANQVTVVLANGQRRPANVLATSPRLGLAVLKIEQKLDSWFDLKKTASYKVGNTIFALSNAYNVANGDEMVSIQRGVLSAVGPLEARAGQFTIRYESDVLYLDANTNNAGATGGAIVDRTGNLLGIIGKELRNTQTNTWVNYAIPTRTVEPFVSSVLENRYQAAAEMVSQVGRFDPTASLDLRGIIPLPNVLDNLPAYIDGVEPDSPAANAGLRIDDLITLVDEKLVSSVDEVKKYFRAADANRAVSVTVRRGEQLITVELTPRSGQSTSDSNERKTNE